MRNLIALSSLALLLATTAARAADPEPAPAGKTAGPPEVAWKDMSKEQKAKFMKTVIVPKMKVAFQKFDPKAFEKFGCATCHGKDAKAREFKMPNPEIHALPNSEEGFKAMLKKKPDWERWAKFMGGEVEPKTAALLGMAPFDPKKPDPNSFGCNRCHVVKKLD